MTAPVVFIFLLEIQWFVLSSAQAAVDNRFDTLPGCQSKCGNVSIPYPFGIGRNCSIANWTQVTCDTSSNPPKATLKHQDFELLEILPSELRVKSIIYSKCYDKYNNVTSASPKKPYEGRLPDDPYTYSSTRNELTLIGCDTTVTDEIYKAGAVRCTAFCYKEEDLKDGVCAGMGCCQTAIANGTYDIYLELKTSRGDTDIRSFDECDHAFMAEIGQYSFNASHVTETTGLPDVSMVLNYGVGYEYDPVNDTHGPTCKEAEINTTTFACKDNSFCYDTVDKYGYLCGCNPGYQGNPYLTNGCQDVDECKDQNNCTNTCTNTIGSYNCSCPKEFHGNGLKNGTGCTKKNIVLQLSLGIGFLLLFVVVGACIYQWIKRRKLFKLKQQFFQHNGGLLLKEKISSCEGSVKSTKIFTAEELKSATNNYDKHQILGQGGSGTVYKGLLSNLETVAIKKSKTIDESQVGQFINEVVILTQIYHRHVVKLLGCCLETEVPLLVYEFVSNGTLYHHIHQESGTRHFISWENRLRIAAEVAGALAYLHSSTSIPIIHRDVKSSNILLDDNYTAKVADFGASRLNPINQTLINTLVQGTMGYLDPEYFHTSMLTEKSDVYSFGVLLAELLTGEKPISIERPEKQRTLATYFIAAMKENCISKLLEVGIVNERNAEQVHAVAELASRCLNLKSEKRPWMKEVAAELERLRGFERHSRVQQSNEESISLAYGHVEPYDTPSGSYTGQYSSERDMKEVAAELERLRGFGRHSRVQEANEKSPSLTYEHVDLYDTPSSSNTCGASRQYSLEKDMMQSMNLPR